MAVQEKCSHNWEDECRSLRDRCAALQMELNGLLDEKNKLGIMYEQLLKEKSDMDRQIGRLEGQIEAYKYCADTRR